MNEHEFRRSIERRAIVMDVDQHRPAAGDHGSWIGRVVVGGPGEDWPHHAGRPLLPLAQIDLRGLPFRPPRLDDLELLTVFIDGDDLPIDTPNGEGWCLRAYRDAARLEPLAAPAGLESAITPLPLHPRAVTADYPCWEDLPVECPPDLEASYSDRFDTEPGCKLGGWPFLVQSEIYWAPWNRHPAAPEYVFQIDSCPPAGWWWGDSGVAYLGRGTADGRRDEWALAWQCY